jgi:hypothetical protein
MNTQIAKYSYIGIRDADGILWLDNDTLSINREECLLKIQKNKPIIFPFVGISKVTITTVDFEKL